MPRRLCKCLKFQICKYVEKWVKSKGPNLSIRVRDKGGVHQVELNSFGCTGVSDMDCERFTIPQGSWSVCNWRARTRLQVGWRERLDPELRGERSCERVELMRVAASNQDAAVAEQISNRMVHARDPTPGQGLEAGAGAVGRVVEDRVQGRVDGIAPSLRPGARAIDNKNVPGGKQDHVAHAPPHGHVLHGPRRVRGGDRHPTASQATR